MNKNENFPSLGMLGLLGFQINWAIERGHKDKISFSEVYHNLENGDFFEFLIASLPNTFDFSLFEAGSDERFKLQYVLKYASEGIKNRESRKVGIETSGLCLIQALIIEVFQQKFWREHY